MITAAHARISAWVDAHSWKCRGECKKVLPVTRVFFKPSQARRGFDSTCRECRNAQMREWRHARDADAGRRPWPKGRAKQTRRVLEDFVGYYRGMSSLGDQELNLLTELIRGYLSEGT